MDQAKIEEEKRLVIEYNQLAAKLTQTQNVREIAKEMERVLRDLEKLKHS